jgi:four helix bundle protein
MRYAASCLKKKTIISSVMKRAGLSVSNSLTEGASRKTKPDKKRFFEISRSFVVEIDNCLIPSLV